MKKVSAVVRTFLVVLAVGVFPNICSAGIQEGVVAYQRGDFSAALHECKRQTNPTLSSVRLNV